MQIGAGVGLGQPEFGVGVGVAVVEGKSRPGIFNSVRPAMGGKVD